MLFRVYWVAALNLMRHRRWQAGCVRAFGQPANFLSFAASLQGLAEASFDAFYSLSAAPRLLAENRSEIEAALSGKSLNVAVSKELEDRLIHFVYARKVARSDTSLIPNSHIALEPKDYRSVAGFPDAERENFIKLYDELCGICHPTAFSLAFLWNSAQGNQRIVQLGAGDDESEILRLCNEYAQAISFMMSLSVTLSAMCLKALNWFSLPDVHSTLISRWDFDAIPLWKKIQSAINTVQ
jgi:hypothetical protein